MDPNTLSTVRWVLLTLVVIQLLATTVFFRRIAAPLLERAVASGERQGRLMPGALRSIRVLRAVAIFNGLLFLGIWWYLGTPDGAEYWARIGSRTP